MSSPDSSPERDLRGRCQFSSSGVCLEMIQGPDCGAEFSEQASKNSNQEAKNASKPDHDCEPNSNKSVMHCSNFIEICSQKNDTHVVSAGLRLLAPTSTRTLLGRLCIFPFVSVTARYASGRHQLVPKSALCFMWVRPGGILRFHHVASYREFATICDGLLCRSSSEHPSASMDLS